MTESHAESRWPTDPARITYPQVIRHLQACAPCVESLETTLRSAHPGARVARRERSGPTLIDNVLARSLSDGDGQAAVMLYDMARASLRQVEPYASEIEWYSEPAPFMDLRADVCTLSKRLRDGGGRLDGLPLATPTVTASADTADRCLDLAERFAPGWRWVEFKKAHSEMVRGNWNNARDAFGSLFLQNQDPHLAHIAARCAAQIAAGTGDWEAVAVFVPTIRTGSRIAAAYFGAEQAANMGAFGELDALVETLTEALVEESSGHRYWVRMIRGLASEMACVVPAGSTALSAIRRVLDGSDQ